MFNKKKKGFTLAELLIVLAIIGVVAALTMPDLVSDYNKKMQLSRFQKLYGQISNAFAMCMADKSIDNFKESRLYNVKWDRGDATKIQQAAFHNFLDKYLQVSKHCGVGQNAINNCFSGVSYTNMNQSRSVSQTLPFYRYAISYYDCVILNSGALVCMKPYCLQDTEMSFVVDTNGPTAKPNMTGKDVFYFTADEHGKLHPDGGGGESDCTKTYSGWNYGCAAKIINDGWKMNY